MKIGSISSRAIVFLTLTGPAFGQAVIMPVPNAETGQSRIETLQNAIDGTSRIQNAGSIGPDLIAGGRYNAAADQQGLELQNAGSSDTGAQVGRDNHLSLGRKGGRPILNDYVSSDVLRGNAIDKLRSVLFCWLQLSCCLVCQPTHYRCRAKPSIRWIRAMSKSRSKIRLSLLKSM